MVFSNSHQPEYTRHNRHLQVLIFNAPDGVYWVYECLLIRLKTQ